MNISLIYAFIPELKERFVGKKIGTIIYYPESQELILQTRKLKSSSFLLFSISHFGYHLEILEEKKSLYRDKKHTQIIESIYGAQIYNIEQINFDRIIKFSLLKQTALGEKFYYDLYFELTGKNSNLILVNRKNRLILDALRKITAKQNRLRQILPGIPYLLPALTKKNLFLINENEFINILDSTAPKQISEIFQEQFYGLDFCQIREILFKTGLPEQTGAGGLTPDQKYHLWKNLKDLLNRIRNQKKLPTVILNENKEALYLSSFDLSVFPKEYKKHFTTLNQALHFYYQNRATLRYKQDLQTRIEKTIASVQKKLNSKIKNLQEELKEKVNYLELKKIGDLIIINKHQIKKSQKSLTVSDIFDPRNPFLKIELDPTKTALENAQVYYRKYRKGKQGLVAIEKNIQSVQEMQKRIMQFQSELQLHPDLETLHKLEAGLIKLNLLKAGEPTSPKTKPQKKSSFWELVPQKGFKILIGKNAAANQELSFRIARSEDLWFHVRFLPGSHLLLKTEQRNLYPTAELIQKAASLAAYFSKARNSDKVEVIYTLAKYLKKPKKGKAGEVLLSHERSILVRPKNLLKDENF